MHICKWWFKKCPLQNTIFLSCKLCTVALISRERTNNVRVRSLACGFNNICYCWHSSWSLNVRRKAAQDLEISKAMSLKKDGWDEASVKVKQKQWGHGSKRNSISVALLGCSYFAGVRLSAIHCYKNISPTAEAGWWLEEWVSRLRL